MTGGTDQRNVAATRQKRYCPIADAVSTNNPDEWSTEKSPIQPSKTTLGGELRW